MKKILIVVVLIIGGVGAFFALSALKEPPPEKSNEVLRSLITEQLQKEDVTPKVAEFAVVTSLQSIAIKSEVSGKVILCSHLAEDGMLVKKGDILVEIDKRDYIIAKQEAEAALDILKADAKQITQSINDLKEMLATAKEDYELEQKNYNRKKELFDKKVYSKTELEVAMQMMSRRKKIFIEAANSLSKQTFLLEATKAKIKQADAMLDKAELDIKRATVRAPISGRIMECNVEEGEYLSVGEKLCTVVNDQQPSLKVPVNADDALKILKIYPGKDQWLKAPDNIKVTIEWLRNPGSCRWSAHIARVESYNRKTDTVSILVVPDKYSGDLKDSFPLLPGMFCKVTFYGKELSGVFKIPFSALQFNDNVFTVDNNGILHRYKVSPFSVEGDKVIILSGLPEGHSVVIQQLPRGLSEGMRVKGSSLVVEDDAISDRD